MRTTSYRHHFLTPPRLILKALILVILLYPSFVLPAWSATPTRLAPDPNLKVLEEIILIRHREFQPNTLIIPVGQKTRLVLKNLDTELHAFVPVGLLAESHVAVSGNGAPQFAKEGFVRVLLPTRGQTQIVFTPVRPGTYPYFCDLPGHVMRGTIVVREKLDMVQ